MNNNHAEPIPYYLRWLTPLLAEASQDHPVVVLTGARQVGKSTLLLNAEPFRGWKFYSLDDFDVLRQAQERPEALWAGAEVDFVLEHGRRVLAVEVKLTDNPGYRDTDGLRRFLEGHPRAAGGVLLHNGPVSRRLDDKIVALP